jgi:hypothetical protein
MKFILVSLLAASTVFAAIPAAGQQKLTLHHHDAAHQPPGTIVVPASDFFTDFPDGDTSGNQDGGYNRPQTTEWQFNNSWLTLAVAGDVTAKIPVKEGGTYHLFVRGSGTPASSFHVAIDGKVDPASFGQGAMKLQRGGDYTLKPGTVEIKLASIQPRPVFNVLVLTKKADFKEDDLKPLELSPEVKLLREYTIVTPNIVKFGDVDGSGKYAILDIANDNSTIMYANDGHELWRWTAPRTVPGESRGNEAGAILWDFHHTGRDELAHWREIDGKEWLVLADGRTGDIIKQVPWPAPALPHVDNNYRMAVAKFHKDADGPDTLLVFADTGGWIGLTAYDKDLNMLWQHAEHRLKDYFGHYIYPYDVNGDGIDEVTISHLCLDANGKEVWNNAKYFADNHDHMDAMEFFDMNGDGKPELLIGQSDAGVYEYNAQNGKMIWQNESDHVQQITAGYILGDSKTPQVVSNGRTYAGTMSAMSAQLYWFDNQGRLLEKWPAHPLIGNPNFVRGDWFGTGKRTYFWYQFKLEPDGNATLYFKGEAFHMFDFEHTGADQVITLDGPTLRVYGYANITPHPKPCNAECRKLIANSTHY